jgi:hypothetical protein
MRSVTKVVTQPPEPVLEAALRAAEQLRLTIDHLDRSAGHLVVHEPATRGRAHRVAVSMIDSGYGATSIHAGWEPGSEPAVLGSRLPARIIRRIVKNLE